MKFEFNMDVKGVPTASVTCKFECDADELVTLISDPVYQTLGQKLVNEVSFAPKAQPKQEVDAEELNRLIKLFGKDMEADKKARVAERELINKLMDRVAKIAERTQKF